MIEIKFSCEQCKLGLLNEPVFVAEGCVDYVKATFDLCSDWSEMASVTANFRAGNNGAVYSVALDENNSCLIPAAAIKYPEMQLALFGTNGDVHITTTICRLPILNNNLEGGSTPEPTPDVYDAIMDSVNKAVSAVNELKKRAEAGEFTGEPFSYYAIYPSVADMNADLANIPENAYVLISSGDINDPENACVYQNVNDAMSFVVDLSGIQGVQGAKGDKGEAGVIDAWEHALEGDTVHLTDALVDSAPVNILVNGEAVQLGTPTPDAPVDVQTLKTCDIYVSGENLFAALPTTTKNGVTFTRNSDGSVTVQGTPTAAWTETTASYGGLHGMKAGKTYTLSCVGRSELAYAQISFYREDDSVSRHISTMNNEHYTFTVLDDETVARFVVSCGNELETERNVTVYPMLVEGSEPAEFAPVLVDHISVPSLPAYGAASIGEQICDFVHVDVKGNVFIQKFVGSGLVSELISDWQYSENGVAHGVFADCALDVLDGYSTHFEYVQQYLSETTTGAWHVVQPSGETSMWAYFKTDHATLDEFLAWVDENNVKIYYKLREPKIIPLGTIDLPVFEDEINNVWVHTNLVTDLSVNYFVEGAEQVHVAQQLALETTPILRGGTGANNRIDAMNNLGVYSLTGGEPIPSGADLNDYVSVGNFYASNSTLAAGLEHTPFTETGFMLKVMHVLANSQYGMNKLIQEALNVTGQRKTRYTTSSGSNWSEWVGISASVDIDFPIEVEQGGTGATNSTDALNNLGAASSAYVAELESQIAALEARPTFALLTSGEWAEGVTKTIEGAEKYNFFAGVFDGGVTMMFGLRAAKADGSGEILRIGGMQDNGSHHYTCAAEFEITNGNQFTLNHSSYLKHTASSNHGARTAAAMGSFYGII